MSVPELKPLNALRKYDSLKMFGRGDSSEMRLDISRLFDSQTKESRSSSDFFKITPSKGILHARDSSLIPTIKEDAPVYSVDSVFDYYRPQRGDWNERQR